jgi:hypothetical protein
MDASHPEIWFLYTVIIPAAPQETVEEAWIEPGTAALQSGSPSRAFANWATTSPSMIKLLSLAYCPQNLLRE